MRLAASCMSDSIAVTGRTPENRPKERESMCIICDIPHITVTERTPENIERDGEREMGRERERDGEREREMETERGSMRAMKRVSE